MSAFHRDSSRTTGRTSWCAECRAEHRRNPKPRPGALVLVMPARPAPPPEDEEPERAAGPPPVVWGPTAPSVRASFGHYGEAVEAFLDALTPPAGAADALLVVNLRDMAACADRLHLGPVEPRDLATVTASMIRLQRELAATRAAKSSQGIPVVATKSKFEAFKDSLG